MKNTEILSFKTRFGFLMNVIREVILNNVQCKCEYPDSLVTNIKSASKKKYAKSNLVQHKNHSIADWIFSI